ncbi:hypothetical protein [Neptunicella sp. SCSIO 80796]|uniref:hypothetical protein n=1 Tax=Neptunicella plasticusilytica TaxID=3117012 RepID=UPI003A4D4A2E
MPGIIRQYRSLFSRSALIGLILLTTLVTGCAVKLVSDYDAEVKEDIIRVAQRVDLFWGELLDTNNTQRTYDRFADQYIQIETDIRALVMRNEIRLRNEESTRQANIALELWVEDRNLHKQNNSFSDFEAKNHRRQFTRLFTTMAKAEEAKKMGPTTRSDGDSE